MSTREIVSDSVMFAFFDEPKTPPCNGLRLNVRDSSLLFHKEKEGYVSVQILSPNGSSKMNLGKQALSEFGKYILLLADNL